MGWEDGRKVEDGSCGGMAGWDEVLHRAAAPAVHLGKACCGDGRFVRNKKATHGSESLAGLQGFEP